MQLRFWQMGLVTGRFNIIFAANSQDVAAMHATVRDEISP